MDGAISFRCLLLGLFKCPGWLVSKKLSFKLPKSNTNLCKIIPRSTPSAKERIFDTNKSLSEIAYALGFKYPQHFSRVFKQHVGMSPLEFRSSMN